MDKRTYRERTKAVLRTTAFYLLKKAYFCSISFPFLKLYLFKELLKPDVRWYLDEKYAIFGIVTKRGDTYKLMLCHFLDIFW